MASTKIYDKLAPKVLGTIQLKDDVISQLGERKAELTKLEEIIAGCKRDFYTVWLILACLISPENIRDYDLDRIVDLMIGLRQIRLGIKPKKVLDAKGNVICECQVPLPYGHIEEYGIGMDEARERLAMCLVPLLKDKFVPRYEYEALKTNQTILNNIVFGYPDTDDTNKVAQ